MISCRTQRTFPPGSVIRQRLVELLGYGGSGTKPWVGLMSRTRARERTLRGNGLGMPWETGMAAAGVGRVLRLEVNAFSRDNVFKVIGKRPKAGFRVDPAHHGNPWGHIHFWRW